MTTSTFSLVISPPLFRWNMRHVGNAERLVPFHRAVNDVHSIGAEHGIGQRRWLPRPSLDLVLSHAIDEFALILGFKLRKSLAEKLAAQVVDRHDRRSIEIGKRRPEIEDAGLKQRFLRWHRQLLVDIMGDTRL